MTARVAAAAQLPDKSPVVICPWLTLETLRTYHMMVLPPVLSAASPLMASRSPAQVTLRRLGLRSVPSALTDIGSTLEKLDLDDNRDLQICADSLAVLRQLRRLEVLSLCKSPGR